MTRIEQVQRAIGAQVTVARQIGAGGFAEVFEGTDERLGRRVAIKVMREDIAAPRARDRFLREARAAAQIRHPNVLAVFDVGELDGIVWFTMPLVVGESLGARMDRERRIEPDEAVRILGAAAAGLHAAHRGGLVHRDVKPDNILLDGPEGHVLLADFGVAAALVEDGDRITTEGAVVGTPRYMSPEQAAGESVIDVRSDVYSLGVVGYEMLAGEPPFTAPTAAALLARHLTAPVPSLRERAAGCPSVVVSAVERALEKDPADRWPTAEAFRQALEGRASSSIAVPSAVESAQPRSIMPRLAVAGAVVVAAAAYDTMRGALFLAPLAVIVAVVIVAITLGTRQAQRAQRPAGGGSAAVARRLRRARALRAASRAQLVSMPKSDRARLGNPELVLDQLLFAAEQASGVSESSDTLDRMLAALAEIQMAVEGTASGDPAETSARVRELVARHAGLVTGIVPAATA